jgi:hypothetical protein
MAALPTQGGTLILPAGLLLTSESINVKKVIIFQGQGGYSIHVGLFGTVIKPAAGKHGFIVHRANTVESGLVDPATGSADNTAIRDVSLVSRSLGVGTTYGVWMRARAHLSHVSTLFFGGNGVHIVAYAGSGGALNEGNANGFTIYGGHHYFNSLSGMYTEGADANAGFTFGVDCSFNSLWGFNDQSFLGNYYFGCHVANNTTGPYRGAGDSNRSTWVGIYAEEGNGTYGGSSFTGLNSVLGGFHAALIKDFPSTLMMAGQVGWMAHLFAQTNNDSTYEIGSNESGFDVTLSVEGSTPKIAFPYWDDTTHVWRVKATTGAGGNIFSIPTDLTAGVTDLNSVDLDYRFVFDRAPYMLQIDAPSGAKYRKIRFERGSNADPNKLAVGDFTLTAAEILCGTVSIDCGGAGRAVTLPTAALLIAAHTVAPEIGDVLDCKIVNGSDAAETITLTAGSGGAFPSNYTTTARVIPQFGEKLLRFRFTNVTASSEAYVVS